MTKIEKGEQVFIINTGELGVFMGYMDKFTVVVDIDGKSSTFHSTAVVKASEFGLDPKKHDIQNNKEEENKIILPHGLHLILVPMRKMNGEIERFQMLVCNRLKENLLMDYTYYLDQTTQEKIKKEITSGADLKLHFFKTDQLNDLPLCDFKFWVKSADGTTNPFNKELKIKAKQFFAQLESDAFPEKNYIAFEIVKEIPGKQEKIKISKKEDDDFWDTHSIKKQDNKIIEKAAMPDHIDLHIEKLEKNFEKLEKGEILHIQLRAFERFLDKAINHHLHRIYAIHGIGKGKLKIEIENILKQTPEVVSYNNDYNSRFGYGATEINL